MPQQFLNEVLQWVL